MAGLLISGGRSVDFETKAMWLNGSPAVWVEIGAQFSVAVRLAVENGRVRRIYAISNPQKLARLDRAAALTRT